MGTVIPFLREPGELPSRVLLKFDHSGKDGLVVVVEDYRTREIMTSGDLKQIGAWLNHNGYKWAAGSRAVWQRR